MEATHLLTAEEKEEALLIRDEMLGIFADAPSMRFKIESVVAAYLTHDLERLRLYQRFLVEFRPFDIDRASSAKTYLGFPAESVDTECMKLVTRFQKALIRDRPESVRSVDAQSMTFLLRHVVANPDDLELVLRIILERRVRGYKEVLKTLDDLKSQDISSPIQAGIL